MLQNTFIHIGGVGERTERRLWSNGIRTWKDFLAACERCPPAGTRRTAREEVMASIDHYDGEKWAFFEERLPTRHKWRSFGDLGEQALYLDIETTGMGPGSEITVIGAYDGARYRAFIAGQDLDDAREWLERYPLVVTFNGASFDMPYIRARFPYALFNHVHIDLRYPLKWLGYTGGLKAIEQRLDILRSEETQGLDGWDAVRLWREYRCGSREALDLLVRYNEEDVRHLQPLMRLAFDRMARRLGMGSV